MWWQCCKKYFEYVCMHGAWPINLSSEISSLWPQCTGYKPRQVAACRPKCTVSRQTAHLAALMLRPTVKRWGMLWCILSFTRRPNSAMQKEKKRCGVTEREIWHILLNHFRSQQEACEVQFIFIFSLFSVILRASIRHINVYVYSQSESDYACQWPWDASKCFWVKTSRSNYMLSKLWFQERC